MEKKPQSIASSERMYHVGLSKEMLKGARYAILPGDPGRVASIANQIDTNCISLAQNREYTSYLAYIDNEPVLVCSTGMGGPSVSIAVEELACLGITHYIRIGTTGAIQKNISLGSLIVSTASVRLDGTSFHYAPEGYPAVADFELTQSLIKQSRLHKEETHFGITASSDTFYPGQERYDSFSGYVRKQFQDSLQEWQKLNVLNFEMESSALFVVCSALKLHAAAIYTVMANRTQSEALNHAVYKKGVNSCVEVIKSAISESLSEKQLKAPSHKELEGV